MSTIAYILRRSSERLGVTPEAKLWRAVMADLFNDLEARVARREAQLQGAGRMEVARGLLREFVHFCAKHPELHRIMTIEGRSDTPRLAWLTETYTARLFGAVAAMTPLVDPTIFRSPVELYYAIIGLAASTFTLAPEYRRLSGREPFDAEQVEAVCVLIERLVLGVETDRPSPSASPPSLS